MSPDRLFGDWRGFAKSVGKIKRMVEMQTGARPVVVGMDKNFISSELSFYDSMNDYGITGGAHLFGHRSLMWAVWFPPSAGLGKDILMIDFDRKRLTSPKLSEYFETLSDVSMENLVHNGRVVGHFYWRVGRAYRPLKAAS